LKIVVNEVVKLMVKERFSHGNDPDIRGLTVRLHLTIKTMN
jgi:hypothetical protein